MVNQKKVYKVSHGFLILGCTNNLACLTSDVVPLRGNLRKDDNYYVHNHNSREYSREDSNTDDSSKPYCVQ